MAVKLRLMRMGKKKQPTYRVVAADSRKARNGRFIEIVGTYNPRQEPSHIEIDNERALHWLRHGAQPSERVQKLLVITGAWAEFTGEPGPTPSGDSPPAKVTQAASAQADESISEPDAPEAEGDAEPESAEAEGESEAESAEASEEAEQSPETAEEEES